VKGGGDEKAPCGIGTRELFPTNVKEGRIEQFGFAEEGRAELKPRVTLTERSPEHKTHLSKSSKIV